VTQGTAYHWDMMVIGCLNVMLSLVCLPWMHAILPHSPLHVRKVVLQICLFLSLDYNFSLGVKVENIVYM
jgi:hypothetical protein